MCSNKSKNNYIFGKMFYNFQNKKIHKKTSKTIEKENLNKRINIRLNATKRENEKGFQKTETTFEHGSMRERLQSSSFGHMRNVLRNEGGFELYELFGNDMEGCEHYV